MGWQDWEYIHQAVTPIKYISSGIMSQSNESAEIEVGNEEIAAGNKHEAVWAGLCAGETYGFVDISDGMTGKSIFGGTGLKGG